MSEVDNPTLLAESVYIKFSSIFEPYFDRVGIPRTVLTEPDTLVPLAKHARLMQVTAEGLGDDCFGLHVGLQLEPTDMGPIGFALMNSPTVKASLEIFSRYLGAYTRGCYFQLKCDSSFAYYDFGYTLPELGLVDRRQEAECTLALLLNIVRRLSGQNWSPVKVYFEHPRPANISEHKRIFGAPVEFSYKVNRLVFNRSFLDQPVKTAQSRLLAVIEEHLQQVIDNQHHEYDLVNQVSNLVARELSNGMPTVDWVAEQLNMTKRTLQRRLTDNGVGFSEIVDDVRRNMAVQYVEKSDISLTEIAFLLGYSHLSAFCRTFRRWTGTTPQKIRSQKAK
ncbi:MAG: AraC-like DNA-binding protein [Halieaceae bacterium]|jgi:AraC-like DNA-binding protein